MTSFVIGINQIESVPARTRLNRLVFLAGCLVLLSLLMACSGDRQPNSAELSGQTLYEEHCAGCHEQQHPDLLKQPPGLHGLFLAKELPSGSPATDEQVRKTIIEGRATMPAFDQRLQSDDVEDLVRYLHTLR